MFKKLFLTNSIKHRKIGENTNTKYLTTAIFLLLLFSSAYIALTPNAHAQEITSNNKETLLQNTPLCLDLTKYNIITTSEYTQDPYLDVLPQENIRYYIESSTSNIDALYTIANGKIRMIHVLQTTGTPYLTTTSSELDMAQNFLSNYQTNTNNPFYGELETMLDEINTNTNSNITKNNIKLDIDISDDGASKTYRWTYTFDGIEASEKCVVLGYKDGFLKYFIDNWDLYTIGSTTINLTEKEAIQIARQTAEKYTWLVGPEENAYKVVNFGLADEVATTQLSFCSSIEANRNQQNKNPFVLYPMWRIGVALDNFYPGNVYGIYVDVWANTKNVRNIQEVFTTLDPPDDKTVGLGDCGISLNAQATNLQVALIGVLSVAIISMMSLLLLKKNRHMSRQRIFKLGGFMLCLLMVITVFSSLPFVNADPQRRFTVWGSTSAGIVLDNSGNPVIRKTTSEIIRQVATSQFISDCFKDDGYYSSNYQGSKGSYKSQILAQISSNEANYDRTAVVDFDHGVGEVEYSQAYGEYHYMFEDNIGMEDKRINPNYINENFVFDMDVYDSTTLRKTYFALINVCLSARYDSYTAITSLGPVSVSQGLISGSGNAQSMPFAWTHKKVTATATSSPPSGYMSCNGYTNPDSGAHCYMGFPYGSAALDQYVDSSYGTVKYYMWLEDFFNYALNYDITINQALDHASYNRFNCNFDQTTLYNNFTADWPGMPSAPGSTLVVYGNGNLRLYEYFVHYPYYSSGSYGSGSVSTPNGFTGPQCDSSCTRLYAPNVNDQASVVGKMGYSGADQARGRIWIYGYSGSSTSRLRIYVSNDGSNWYLVNNNVLVSPITKWTDCGSYSSNFKYISIAAYRESSGDYSNNVYIDRVLVLPSLPNP